MSNPSSPPLRKPRRWLSFSLRTFLVVVVVLSFGLGWIANLLIRVRQQRAVVAQIEKIGGRVWYEHEDSNNRPPGSYLVRYFIGDDAYAHVSRVEIRLTTSDLLFFNQENLDACVENLATLPRLDQVQFAGVPLSRESLATIGKYPSLGVLRLEPYNELDDLSLLAPAAHRLRFLELTGLPADGKAIETLPKLPQLDTLVLTGPRVTVAGMWQISSSRHLHGLAIEQSQQIDEGALEAIAWLPGLREVNVAGTPLTPGNMRELSRFELHTLRIQDCPSFQMDETASLDRWQYLKLFIINAPAFNDHHAAQLSACQRLDYLSLEQTGITDAAMPGISQLGNLRQLHLVGTAVTGDGFRQLHTLEKLRLVSVSPLVTASDVHELQKHLPHCIVLIEDARSSTVFRAKSSPPPQLPPANNASP